MALHLLVDTMNHQKRNVFEQIPKTSLKYESYLHHEMKFDTLSRAKKVPLLAAGKK